MKNLTLITGNKGKLADYQRFLKNPIDHHDIDLTEVQSLDLDEVLEHKAKEAYSILKSPVIIDDTSLEFHALGRLPGPFIKFFVKEIGNEGICNLMKNYSDKSALYTVGIAYFNGKDLKIFKSEMTGKIADEPKGQDSGVGFGWDSTFVIDGFAKTRAEMSQEEYDQTNGRRNAISKLEEYLETLK